MHIINFTLSLSTTGTTDIVDITATVMNEVAESGISDGHVILFVPGSTASLTTIEYESGVIEYRHDARWHDGNGYSHVRAALLGPSLTVPVVDRRVVLGTWQQIIVIDFDNRPRQRRIAGQIYGR
jgi:secondary thiamine-phosphate synthase enzyme